MATRSRQVARKETRPRDGLSVATKLTLLIASVVALCMLVFGAWLRGFIQDAVKEQVAGTARAAASAAAVVDLEAWSIYFGTRFQGQSAAEVQEFADGLSRKEYDAIWEDPEFRARVRWNTDRLWRLVERGQGVIAAELWTGPPGGERELLPSYAHAIIYSRLADIGWPPGEREALGTAEEGELTLEGEPRAVLRGTHPILDRDGKPVGELVVYVDAAAVGAVAGRLMVQVLYAGSACLGLSIVAALVLGRRAARPLRLLREDIHAVAAGDLAHRTLAHTRDEIGDLARTFDAMTRSLAEAQERDQEAAAGRHQLTVAAEVAQGLIPAQLPEVPGYELAALHEGSGSLGGECHLVLPVADGRIGLIVATASGSGLPAALVVTMARSFLDAVGRHRSDPGAILREVNALLSTDLRRGMYVTALMVVLDPLTGELQVANAGHGPLLLVDAATGRLVSLASEGIALGFDRGLVFDRTLKLASARLAPGDTAILSTAGAAQVPGADGQPLGEARLHSLLRREVVHPAATAVRRLAALIARWRGAKPPPLAADVTLVVLRRQAPGGGT